MAEQEDLLPYDKGRGRKMQGDKMAAVFGPTFFFPESPCISIAVSTLHRRGFRSIGLPRIVKKTGGESSRFTTRLYFDDFPLTRSCLQIPIPVGSRLVTIASTAAATTASTAATTVAAAAATSAAATTAVAATTAASFFTRPSFVDHNLAAIKI